MSVLSKFVICMIGGVTVGSCVTYFIITRGQSNVNSGTTNFRGRIPNESLVRGETSPEGQCETDSLVVAKEMEKIEIHTKLMINLNDEIGNSPACRFLQMVYASEDYLGRANAQSCDDFQQLAVAFQNIGGLSPGNYDLLLKIFEMSKYADATVLKMIRQATDRIQMLDRLDDQCTSLVSSQGGRFKYDGVILYTDDDRDAAIRYKTDIKAIMQGDLKVLLEEELGTAGQQTETEIRKFVEECMFIYVMVSDALSEDALRRFKIFATFCESIEQQEWRVVPVMTANVKSPGILKYLVSQKYYKYADDSFKGVFQEGFRMSISQGRRGEFS